MGKPISIEVKRRCCEMYNDGLSAIYIYEHYFKNNVETPQSYRSFKTSITRWMKHDYNIDESTLEAGTYDGFIAHDATVQVSKSGEIIQAWIKQKAGDMDPEEFLNAIKDNVEPFKYVKPLTKESNRMLEIPLFDMHWGLQFMDTYNPALNEILELIFERHWDKIVIPFGQDFFHNDSIVNGTTTKGTIIEKVDMPRAVKEGKQFMYSIIDASISNANEVKVIYSSGNHDRSVSWMFIQVLLERYGKNIVDDSLDYRKVISYGKNSVMVTHGDSKQATPKNLAQIFPIKFPEEFSKACVREVHSGHLHREGEADIHGVMVRRLSSGSTTDEWSDREDYVGSHKRFMVFDWDSEKLKSIHYI